MKTALAILSSSLLLCGQMMAIGQSASCDRVTGTRQGCCHCENGACCRATSSPQKQSAPAIPLPVASDHQLLTVAGFAVAWVLPDSAASEISLHSSPPLTAMGVSLFERDCARLL